MLGGVGRPLIASPLAVLRGWAFLTGDNARPCASYATDIRTSFLMASGSGARALWRPWTWVPPDEDVVYVWDPARSRMLRYETPWVTIFDCAEVVLRTGLTSDDLRPVA